MRVASVQKEEGRRNEAHLYVGEVVVVSSTKEVLRGDERARERGNSVEAEEVRKKDASSQLSVFALDEDEEKTHAWEN